MITIPTTFAETEVTSFGTFKTQKAFNQRTRWGIEKLASAFDGDSQTKSLYFGSVATLFYDSPTPALNVSQIELTTANDVPERDPSKINLHFKDGTITELTVEAASSRWQKLIVPTSFNTNDLVAIQLTSTSGSIVQFAELKFVGVEAEPAPDPDPAPEPVVKEIDFIRVVFKDGESADFFEV